MEKRKRPPLPLDASPQEKYDNLILTFFEEWQEGTGARIEFFEGYPIGEESVFGIIQKDYPRLGFKALREFLFYFEALIEKGHLFTAPRDDGNGSTTAIAFHSVTLDRVAYDLPSFVRISFSGLNYCHSLLSSGKDSTRCFVAMKYADDMVPYYDEGIAKAVEDNGFRPIRVDREHADNEQTINDFIIASIKQSRFCVADLTHQSHGAYFEAGYALGRGLKVIYTCHEKDWDNLHFDVKSFQVLKYASVEELRERLSLKIQAFVMD